MEVESECTYNKVGSSGGNNNSEERGEKKKGK